VRDLKLEDSNVFVEFISSAPLAKPHSVAHAIDATHAVNFRVMSTSLRPGVRSAS
jgi:hypothetical protein